MSERCGRMFVASVRGLPIGPGPGICTLDDGHEGSCGFSGAPEQSTGAKAGSESPAPEVGAPTGAVEREIAAFRQHLEEKGRPVAIARQAVINRAREVVDEIGQRGHGTPTEIGLEAAVRELERLAGRGSTMASGGQGSGDSRAVAEGFPASGDQPAASAYDEGFRRGLQVASLSASEVAEGEVEGAASADTECPHCHAELRIWYADSPPCKPGTIHAVTLPHGTPDEGGTVGWTLQYLDDESHTWEWIGEPLNPTMESAAQLMADIIDGKMPDHPRDYEGLRVVPVVIYTGPLATPTSAPVAPRWKVPCPVCEGRGVLKEAVQGWDVGQPAPECPHCDEGTLDLETLIYNAQANVLRAPSPREEGRE